ncbi:Flagellum-specific ATP synthase FliI [Staphylococcus aureus M1057]|nr:Flagellum-specific ATP synthase FliI [Staphylococcus aureus M1057]
MSHDIDLQIIFELYPYKVERKAKSPLLLGSICPLTTTIYGVVI